MKKGLITLALTGLVLGGAFMANAATTFIDTYIDEGGIAAYAAIDSIGGTSQTNPAEGGARFDIEKTVVTVAGTRVTFDLYSLGAGGYFPGGMGVYGLGDLFLDTNGGKTWNYAVTLNSKTSPLYTGSTALYSVAQGNIANGSVRTNQAALFTPTGSVIASDTWTIKNTTDYVYNYLSITTDLAGVWNGTTALGFHWTMTCGNDVVQNILAPTPVPVPSSLLLLSAGFAGLVGFARPKAKR